MAFDAKILCNSQALFVLMEDDRGQLTGAEKGWPLFVDHPKGHVFHGMSQGKASECQSIHKMQVRKQVWYSFPKGTASVCSQENTTQSRSKGHFRSP